jgi:hypothetical protein
MEIVLNPKRVTLFFAIIVLVLALAHIGAQLSKLYLGHDYIFGLVPGFDLNLERNIPTLYSALALSVCAVFLLIIALGGRGKPYFFHWLGLSFIFIYLSVDEYFSIHEKLNQPLRSALDTSGFLLYAWVIPFSILLVILLLIYLRFLIDLPRKTKLLFLLAAFIYVVGALVFELFAGWAYTLFSTKDSIAYLGLSTVEELMEMVGIVIFIYALLDYIDTQMAGLRIRISSSPTAESPPE